MSFPLIFLLDISRHFIKSDFSDFSLIFNNNSWCCVSVVAPILNVLCVLLDVLQLSVALLISRHHLLLWLLISHLTVLLAQAEFLFVFCVFCFFGFFWCLSYLYWDSFLLLIKTVLFFQIFGSMGLCLDIFIKSALKFSNPTSGSTWSQFLSDPFYCLVSSHATIFSWNLTVAVLSWELLFAHLRAILPELRQNYFPCTV